MHLIFDFDGTIIDNFQFAIDTFNVLAEQLGFRKIEPLDVGNLKNLTSKEIMKYLKIPAYKIPIAISKAKAIMSDQLHTLSPIKNIHKVLYQLNKAGVCLGILTTNSVENVTNWLKQHDMHDYFSFIQNESNYFGKARKLKKLLKHRNIDKQHTFYIGDETRDIDAAKQCGVFSIAVTWGFNNEQALFKCNPNFLIRNPTDLLEVLKDQSR